MIESILAPFAGQRGPFAGRSGVFAGIGGTSPIVGVPAPTFWAPLTDAGAGAVNLTLNNGTGSATFTRATTAWAKLASGLWASVASGTARAHYLGADTTVGSYGGGFIEEARTNLCLQSRDLSNASWTKTTATAAKDQVGIDGAANSASSLTATAGGGSCVQTITEAATNSALSFFIKRLVGTGTITLKQGATTLDVTASINSATYTRVALVASVLNPSIGIVLGTNGDKIAVDMVQFENGAFATSPIPTTTVSVTRNIDVLTYPTSGNVAAATGTFYLESANPNGANQTNAGVLLNIDDGSGNNRWLPFQLGADATKFQSSEISATVTQGTITGAITVGTGVNKFAFPYSPTSAKLFINGVAEAATIGANTAPVGLTTMRVGAYLGAVLSSNSTIKNVRIWARTLTDGQIATL